VLPPTVSPEIHLSAEMPPTHGQRVLRWLLLLAAVFLLVSLMTTLLLPHACTWVGPTGNTGSCDKAGTLPDFLASLAVFTLVAGVAALASGILGAVMIRRARRTVHP
jgi:ABC-type Fe3+ transport system permease subunit